MNKKEIITMQNRHVLGTLVVLLGLTFGVYAGEKDATKPPQKPSSKTEVNKAGGKVPPEIEAAMQVPEGKEREKALNAAALEWLKKDPIAALVWAHQLPDSLKYTYYSVAVNCGNHHPKITADWCLQEQKYNTLHQSMHVWAGQDPAAASDWCMKSPDEVHFVAFASLGDGWGWKDPVAAAAWASQLKSMEDRRAMAFGIGRAWTFYHYAKVEDTMAATTWAAGLPTQEERLAAIRGIGVSWARKDFPAFTVWVKTLKDRESIRVAAFEGIRQIRYIIGKDLIPDKSAKKDPDAFIKKWLDQLQLSEADKKDVVTYPFNPFMSQVGKIEWPK